MTVFLSFVISGFLLRRRHSHISASQLKNKKHIRLIYNTRRPEKRFGNKNYLNSFRLLHAFHKTNRAQSIPPAPHTPTPALPAEEKTSEKTLPEMRQSESTGERQTASPIRMQRSSPSRASKFRKEKAQREGRERLGASQASLSRGFVPVSNFLVAARTGVRRELVVAYFLNCGVLALQEREFSHFLFTPSRSPFFQTM